MSVSFGDWKYVLGEDMARRIHPTSRRQILPKISLSPAQTSPGKLLHDADVLLGAGLVQTLQYEGHRISIEAWSILNLLWEEDNLAQFEIALRIGKDRHQTSRLIDSLHQQGLVTRESKDEDRRIKRVVLTDKGCAAKTPLRRVATKYLEDIFSEITREEYDVFIRCLQHVTEKLKTKQETKELA